MAEEGRGDVRAAIAAVNRAMMATFAQGDAAALAAFYTSDGQILAPHREVLRGPQAIGAFWQGSLDAGFKQLVLDTRELEAHGDTAHEVGEYTIYRAAGELVDRGKYVVIWKRQDGQWKLYLDIANSNLPAAPVR
jgi:uncharacterized protein (TIGR02246 family)